MNPPEDTIARLSRLSALNEGPCLTPEVVSLKERLPVDPLRDTSPASIVKEVRQDRLLGLTLDTVCLLSRLPPWMELLRGREDVIA